MENSFSLNEIIPNKAVNVVIKPNRLAKRLILRADLTNIDTVIVTIPTNTYISKNKISKFIISKKKWIGSRLQNYSQKKVITFETNLSILGRIYKIKPCLVDNTKLPYYQQENTIYLFSKNFDHNLKLFLSNKLSEYIDYKISQLNIVESIKIKVSITKSKWGTCVKKKDYFQLQFCLFLIFAPLDVIDYVIYHELSHVKYMDHSEKFWKTVENYFPNYKQSKKWLRINGQVLAQYKNFQT